MKFRVYGVASASTLIGIYEAESAKEAENIAANDSGADVDMGLCYHCARKVEIGDIYEYEADEAE